MIVYLNGQFVPKAEARISPDDRGFLLADGVYEVTRSYPGGHLFKLDAHLARLTRSLDELRIPKPDLDFQHLHETLLKKNNLVGCHATVYLQISRGAAPRQHAFPAPGTPSTIYGFAAPFELSPKNWTDGVRVITAPDLRWARCDIKSLALLPNVLANQQAHEQGAEEALLIRDGAITEGSHTSFCAVFDGTLYTYPDTNYILPGITRGVVLDLCHDLNIPVRKFPILTTKLRDADECMILGTGSEVTPVVQIDDWQVGTGNPGPITRQLQEAYFNLHP